MTPPPLAAVVSVRCGADGEPLHRVGVTTRGQAVLLDHDRELERLAEGLEPEARSVCADVYDGLVSALTAPRRAVSARPASRGEVALSAATTDADELERYLVGAERIRTRRAAVEAHTLRLTQISVLAGGPSHLVPWVRPGAPHAFRDPDAVVRQAQLRAKDGIVERLVPELFLRAGYPIVRRHPPSGPGVRRGACWHVTVTDLGPDNSYPVATRPHPDGRGRVCHFAAVPLAPDWYRDVYKEGLAILDGRLVVKLGAPCSGGPGASGVLLLTQRGARLHLEDRAAERTPDGWRLIARPSGGGTGVRPSPWD